MSLAVQRFLSVRSSSKPVTFSPTQPRFVAGFRGTKSCLVPTRTSPSRAVRGQRAGVTKGATFRRRVEMDIDAAGGATPSRRRKTANVPGKARQSTRPSVRIRWIRRKLPCWQLRSRGRPPGMAGLETVLSPTIDAISVKIKKTLQKSVGSLNINIPTKAVPTAPIPVHTG